MRRLLIAVFALLASLPVIANAQTPKVHWTNYAYQITVQKNGDLQFTETQQLAIDSGSVRKGSLRFDTGSLGQVRQIQVAEDGMPYNRDTSQATGTYSGTDNGTFALINYYFRDPVATRHTMTISYIVAQAIHISQGQPTLQLKLFCQGSSCPSADTARAQINFVAPLGSTPLQAKTTGFSVQQTPSAQGLSLVSTSPVAGQSLTVNLAFPLSLIPDANLNSQPAAQNNPNLLPPNGVTTQPVAPRNFTISPVLCVVIIFFLIVVISIRRSSTRRGIPYGGPMMGGPMMGGYPRRRRWGGFFPWGGYGGWGGGWDRGYGPMPPDVNPPVDPSQPTQPDQSGGQSWSDSGSGGQSWSDSGSGGQSWSDSSGGGSFSVGDSGGGGSFGGDSGGSFGGDNNSSFS